MSKKFDKTNPEHVAVKALDRFLKNHGAEIACIWHWGNGNGSGVLDIIEKSLLGGGHIRPEAKNQKRYQKKKLPYGMRTEVFERDKYRCVNCGSHRDLCVDHIHPESLGGEAVLGNLQTLCRPCNSKKCALTEGWK
jgi:hypothetical protein